MTMRPTRAALDIGRAAGYHLLLRIYNALLTLPGHRFRVWVLRTAARHTIGPGTAVERGVRITGKGGITVGSRCNINAGVLLDGRGGLRLGHQVNISPEALLLTAEHDPRSQSFEGSTASVDIGDRVWIATRAIILPGTVIEEGAVIGAGAVARGRIPANTIWVGNPARQVGQRPPDAQSSLENYRRWWH